MNAKEISDSTLESVTPAADDLMLIYDTSEGTTGKATIAGIAPKVAENINISTLPAVTPAADDVLMLRDTSEGTTGKATIAEIAPKVAENITNIATLGIIEASALSNIGTVANATQHDVNVAIDSVIEEMQQYDDADYVEIQGLTHIPQINAVTLHAKRKGNVVTLQGYFEINLTGSSHYTLRLLEAGSLPTKYRPTINVSTTSLGYRNSETTYMIGRFLVDIDGSVSLGEFYTSGNDQSITVFNFIMTYVV